MASDQIANTVVVRVEEKLRFVSAKSIDRSIFKVPDHLRKGNEKAYEPEILAIGPYHHGNKNLEAMEVHKIRYLQQLLQRTGESKLSCYAKAVSELEEQARKCYEGSISLDSDEFVEMMLLDSCFIVEVICKTELTKLREDNDPIFELDWMLPFIARDMFLLENQLPFFVVWELFSMGTEIPGHENSFFEMILHFFSDILHTPISLRIDNNPVDKIKHLVGYVHDNWLPAHTGSRINGNNNHNFICCATEIQKAGIKFQKVENVEGRSLFDIEFNDGVMKIPTWSIGDPTESVFRNLIVYEQFFQDTKWNIVLDYIKFMDSLINTPKDAEVLRRHGIIDNWLGDDEVIAKLINSFCDGVVMAENFYYSDVCKRVNLHCDKPLNQWKATLRHDYFNTPWAIISFLAAFTLLILTLQQTIFSVLSYIKQPN